MCVCVSPFSHVPSGLEEARVVVLLQAVLGLSDEGAGALQTLAAVGNLLGQLPQLHHLHMHTHGGRADTRQTHTGRQDTYRTHTHRAGHTHARTNTKETHIHKRERKKEPISGYQGLGGVSLTT